MIEIRRLIAVAGTMAALGLCASGAWASSILVDQGSATYDPKTHLTWLDLSATMGQSYDAVAAGYGGYTTAGGYHIASMSELRTLFDDAGAPGVSGDVSFGSSNPAYNAASLLLQLMGVTRDDSSGGVQTFNSFAYVAEVYPSPYPLHFRAFVMASHDPGTGMYLATLQDDFPPYYDYVPLPDHATYLVKEASATTPLPASLLLFLTAIAGIGGLAWRQGSAMIART